jgi:AmmeMemoRadiSam system protein B
MRPNTSERVRPTAAAGSFYPGSAHALAAEVDALIADVRELPEAVPADVSVRGAIVPHAGYVYSGPVAASAYALLASEAEPPVRIVILGPSHFVPLRGLAVPSHRAWRTPLGELAIDDEARQALLAAGAVADDAAHGREHSIEVQLPFIQRCFAGVPLLPVAVGAVDAREAAASLDPLLTETALLVVSTDLSHYRDHATARQLDERTAAAVEALDGAAVRPDDACGSQALRVAMAWASWSGARIALLDLRDSSDTAGDASRVVGYGAFAITTPRR